MEKFEQPQTPAVEATKETPDPENKKKMSVIKKILFILLWSILGIFVLLLIIGFLAERGIISTSENSGEENLSVEKLRKPHTGIAISSTLVKNFSEDGWQVVLQSPNEVKLLKPEQITTTLYDESATAIRMKTENGITASRIIHRVSIPRNADLLKFCFVSPKAEGGDWITVHFTPEHGTESTLLWSFTANLGKEIENAVTGDRYMSDASIILPEFRGKQGDLIVTLNGAEGEGAEVIFTNFRFLSENDVLKINSEKGTYKACQISVAATEPEEYSDAGREAYRKRLQEVTDSAVLKPEQTHLTSRKLATVSPSIQFFQEVVFNPAGDQVAYSGRQDPNVAVSEIAFLNDQKLDYAIDLSFTADGKHFAFIRNNDTVVFDGIPSEQYRFAAGARFFPGTDALMYVAIRNKKYRLVVHGTEGPPYDGVYDVTISPNGKHVAYVIKKGDKMGVVVDDKESELYDSVEQILFSPDSKRVGFRALKIVGLKRKQVNSVVVDGKEGKWYDWIGAWGFGAGSDKVFFAAQDNGGKFMVVDGKEHDRHDDISNAAITASGTLIYSIRQGDKYPVLVDGKPVNVHTNFVGNIILSSDGMHYAYAVRDEVSEKYSVIMDSRELPGRYDGVGNLIFSKTNILAYSVQEAGSFRVILNGLGGRNYASISNLNFINGSDQLWYLAKKETSQGKKEVLVAGKKEFGNYEQIFANSVRFAQDASKVLFGVHKENELWQIVEFLK